MPYIVKSTTSWDGAPLPDDEVIAKVLKLSTKDFTDNGFNPAPVWKMRAEAQTNGDLLARNSFLSPDGFQVIITMVWKDEAAYEAYKNNPIMLAYIKAMEDAGWKVEVTPQGN